MILYGGWKDLTLLMFFYRRQKCQTEIWKPKNSVKISIWCFNVMPYVYDLTSGLISDAG